MTPKDELLNQAARAYNAFQQAIHGLSEDLLAEVWFGTWGVREILAHVSGWQREMGPALERITRGEKPIPDGVSYDDLDAWNARFVAAKRDWSMEDIELELDRSHEYVMHLALQVPEERVRPGKTAYMIIDLNTANHYREHAEQVLAWRASRNA